MKSNATPLSWTILSVDYGARRTGLAVGQTFLRTSTPLKTLEHPWHRPDWHALDKLFARWQPHLVVIGFPLHPGGTEPQPRIAAKIKRFGTALAARYAIEIQYIDESYTSELASAELRCRRRDKQMNRPISKTDIDAVAATIILDSWFELHTPTTPTTGKES
ncbi:MAG: Holliday junction resolvase RuvX [Gammaproteobacteria bacterium]|nr:Holliday junction resolvase RuvX [Gammaproteobacteria bacterium]